MLHYRPGHSPSPFCLTNVPSRRRSNDGSSSGGILCHCVCAFGEGDFIRMKALLIGPYRIKSKSSFHPRQKRQPGRPCFCSKNFYPIFRLLLCGSVWKAENAQHILRTSLRAPFMACPRFQNWPNLDPHLGCVLWTLSKMSCELVWL